MLAEEWAKGKELAKLEEASQFWTLFYVTLQIAGQHYSVRLG
jgi:hypothetical protein